MYEARGCALGHLSALPRGRAWGRSLVPGFGCSLGDIKKKKTLQVLVVYRIAGFKRESCLAFLAELCPEQLCEVEESGEFPERR